MGRHKLTPPRRHGVTAALAVSCVALGGLVAFGLSADGQQPAAVSGDQTCSFTVTDTVVSTLACVAAPTTPPATTPPSSSPSASPTPSPTETTPPATTTPPPSPSPTQTSTPPATGFPNADNTGVPAGTALLRVPQDVKSGGGWAWNAGGWINVTGNNADLAGLAISGDVNITGTGTLIKDSRITGEVKQGYPSSGAISVVDSEVDNGTAQVGAIVATNLTVTRSNIHGGQQAIHCDDHCTVTDSFLHGQYNPTTVTAHLGGFLSSGGGHITLTHNTIQCDAAPHGNGGCSGDLNLYGDFGPITDVTVTNNLFPGINNDPSYCVYGGSSTGKAYNTATKVTFTGNQFGAGPNGKCGQFGPLAGWTASGNAWSGNTWADGPAAGNTITP